MKTKFLQGCIGITIVLFSLGFFVRSFIPANAQITTNQNTNGNNGKYQIAFSTCVDANYIYYSAVVCNTETGKSDLYSATGGGAGWTKATGGWSIPAGN